MGERRIRIGVIGAGTFAEEAHIPGLQAHRQGDVVALCARNQPRAAALAARLGVPDVYTDYHELLARPDIEAVTIATPDALHAPIALAALEAGKHVFCEKPLAMTVAQAEQMVAAATRADRIAMVGFTFRYTRALQTLRRLLSEGALGTSFHVSLHVHWGAIGYPGPALGWADHADQAAAGAWGDAAAHLFDALAYLLAPVREVCAQMMIVPRGEGQPQPDSVDIATCLASLRLPGYEDTAADGSAFADRERGQVQATLFASRVD
ncbi:MAG: Gfo/Idh/MocA family protein, partial [Chloroflexota bacterium]